MKVYCYFILLMLSASTHGQETNNTTCNSLQSLIKALYDTPGNLKKLNQVFYPPYQSSTSFLQITYSFKNENDQLDGCDVAYLWAEGGFLLIQPPSVFRFTSLLFNHDVNEINNLSLTFPNACRHLVENSTTGECKCEKDLFDILTHKLKLFAKFIDVSNIIEDDSTRVYAICDTELEYFYYNKHEKFRIEVFFFFFLMLFVPFIFITTSLVVTRSCKESISIVATKKSSHQNLVAVVLTGIFMTYFILACDIAAVAHAYQPSLDTFNETHNLSESFNYISTISLLVFDVFSSSIFIGLPMLYVCINNMTQDSIFDNDKCRHKCCDNDKCKKCYMDCYRTIYTWPMYILLGFTNQDEYWTKEKLDNYRLVWIVVSSLAAPLFCVGSHAGFILVAWLTDTSQASSIGLLSMAVLFYMFLMFRQCYKANDQIKPECWCQSCCLCFFPVGSCIKYVFSIFWCCCCCLKKDKRKGCEKCMFSKRERSGELMNLTSIKYTSYSGNADDSADDSDRNYEGMWWQCCQTCITSETTPTLQETPSPQQCQGLNSIALAIVYAWGWVLVSTVVVTLGGFVALPITTFDALSRILDTFEVFVLLFSLLITYKILSLGEPDINRFLQKIRRKYINNKRKGNTNREPNDIEAVEDKILDVEDKTLDDIEAVGSLVGELAEVVIHKLKKE